jgi:hypothetical protein
LIPVIPSPIKQIFFLELSFVYNHLNHKISGMAGMASFSIYTDHGLSDDEDHPPGAIRAEGAEGTEARDVFVTWGFQISWINNKRIIYNIIWIIWIYG